jgi:DNA-binding IclR family transcriptional regulator
MPLEAYTKFTIKTLRALLIDLAEARQLGYALSFGEHELGVGTVAAPIIINGVKQEMRCVGIVSVAAPTSRMDRAALKRCGPIVGDTAQHLAAAWPVKLLAGTSVINGGAQREWGHRN